MISVCERAVDRILEATVVGSFSAVGHHARSRLEQWDELGAMPDTQVLITGGTSGIGRATARALCELGADVMITSRSLDRAETVARDIETEATTAESGVPVGSVRGAQLDTADFASINALVARIESDIGPLDVLINNAGALTDDYRTNDDGMELTLASHLVGPYHLTRELRPLMTAGARVLWMSSGGMYTQGLDVDTIEMSEDDYRGAVAYARAKRGQVELVRHLAPQWASDVVMHVMHPGWVDTDGVAQGLPGFSRLMGPVLRTVEQGADTMVWLAAGGADDAEPGSFFLDRRSRGTSYLPGTSTDDAERRRLVEWLELVTLPARNSDARLR